MTEYLWPVQDDHCRWGFINSKGIVVSPQFDNVYNFSEGLASVLVDDKWGFINRAGEMVIPPQFDDCADGFSEGLASVRVGYKWGAIDLTGNLVIPFQFDLLCMFSEGLAIAYISGTVKKKWDDEQLEINKMRLAYSYPDEIVKNAKQAERDANQLVIDGGRWGVVDKTGTFVISPRFNADGERDLEDTFPTRDGFKHGILKFFVSDLIDEEPEAQPASTEIEASDTASADIATELSEDEDSEASIPPQETRKYGMINRYGDIVVEPVWDEIYEDWGDDGLLCAYNKSTEEDGIGEEAYLKPNGEIVFTNNSLHLRSFYDGMATARNKDGLIGFVNTHGQLVIDCQFCDAGDFSEGLADVTYSSDDESPLYGYIDKTGQMIIPEQFTSTCDFNKNGFAMVRDQNYKWRLIDRSGNFILPPEYNVFASMTDINDDEVLYKFQDGKRGYGVIDHKGNVIVKPIYGCKMFFSNGIIGVELEEPRYYEPMIYFNRLGEVIFQSTPIEP
jgi:hypothetical protein